MTRTQSFFAALVVAAIVAVVPAANAQVHFVGAGSSAQYQTASLAAYNDFALSIANGTTTCAYHWTGSGNGQVKDARNGAILPEPGNLWVVWVQPIGGAADCAPLHEDATQVATDIWADISVDSTVGVRAFLAEDTTGLDGDTLNITGNTVGNRIASVLFTDNTVDAALNTGVQTTLTGQHFNAGLTDIRPEDALFATTRALTALNTTTYKGLGYTNLPPNIGAAIQTSEGTGTDATPIKFALSGNDPISHQAVRSFTTLPIGAAPIVFIANNSTGTPFATNLITDISATSATDKPAAHLFDGTTVCSTNNKAFSASNSGTGGTNITLFLREPLSGTMNTTEFDVFRTLHNVNDTQEKGIISPNGGSPYNPLNLACAGGGGNRRRAIGTGEVVGKTSPANGVLGTPFSLGYIFFGFGNAKTLAVPNVNYLTVDGVDPLQTTYSTGLFPSCAGPCTVGTGTGTDQFGWSTAHSSYPHLRDGSYKVWSLYRWLTPTDEAGEVDNFGPAHLAQATQNAIDTTVADFVPFCTTDMSDSLDVYRSHFTQSGKTGNNGPVSACGNSRGGGTEAGGDMGGMIEGPFEVTAHLAGNVSTTGTTNNVTWKSGDKFVAGAILVGQTIVINGTNYTITTPNPTATVLHVTVNPPKFVPPGVPYTIDYNTGAPNNVLNKKQ